MARTAKPRATVAEPALCALCRRPATVPTISPSVMLCARCSAAVERGRGRVVCPEKGCDGGTVHCAVRLHPVRCWRCEGTGFVYVKESAGG